MVVSVHLEIESKFDPEPDARLPRLDQVPGVGSVGEAVEQRLEAVYFDTPDLALAASGITLRRRTGGDDAGWHLKRPLGNGDREELRLPLGRMTKKVPEGLQAAVRVHTRGQPLAAVATINTVRVMHRLLDDEGAVLAEVLVDTVAANTTAVADGDSSTRWQEWEVELVGGTRGLLHVIETKLKEAGAAPAAGPSKLRRALQSRLPAPTAIHPEPSLEGPASSVVHTHLREQIVELKTRDPQVRQNKPDSVHKMRVATRRLRSALATFGPLLDRQVTDPLRQELKWLATVLGDARDAEVIRERITAMINKQPPELVIGPVTRRIGTELRGSYRAAHARVVAALDSERYFRLLDALDALDAHPPWTGSAGQRAASCLTARVHRDWKRLRDHASAVATGTPHRDDSLHDVRKAAKRVRYASEVLEPVFARPAADLAEAAQGVQKVLGDHQDRVVTRDLLRRLGVQAHGRGENVFTYGRLHALEEARNDDTEHQFARAWADASDKRLRKWLKC